MSEGVTGGKVVNKCSSFSNPAFYRTYLLFSQCYWFAPWLFLIVLDRKTPYNRVIFFLSFSYCQFRVDFQRLTAGVAGIWLN
jgi:hypothetical protein